MDNRIITRVIEILETEPDFFVPVKKLWLMLQGEGLALDVELEDFHHTLTGDERFESTSGVDYKEGFEGDLEYAEEMEREMEALGFYSGPRVKLASTSSLPGRSWSGKSKASSGSGERNKASNSTSKEPTGANHLRRPRVTVSRICMSGGLSPITSLFASPKDLAWATC